MERMYEEDDSREGERIEIRYEEDDMIKQLYKASMRGYVPTLNELIQKDPLILNNISLMSLRKTLLHISASFGHLDFTTTLLYYKPKLAVELDSHNRLALHLASAEGHTEIVKALLEVNKDVCLVADEEGRIPLHYAAMRGRIEVIQLLINEQPESIWVKADREKTVLHLCVLYNHLEALKVLVEYRNDNSEFLNSKDHDGGNTILHLAVMLKRVETMKYLLSTPGVEKNAKNGIGFTALDVIEQCSKDLEIRNLLMTKGVEIGKNQNDLDLPPLLSSLTKVIHVPHGHESAKAVKKCIQLLKDKIKKRIGSLGYSADWSDKTREALMLVSTVITTATFQCAINPPGGVWQDYRYLQVYPANATNTTTIFRYLDPNNATDDEISQFFSQVLSQYSEPDGSRNKFFLEAGAAVLAYLYPEKYYDFFVKTTISFIASLCVIILLVSGVPLSNKFWSWLLTIFMTLTLIFMGLAYLGAMWLVTPGHLIQKVNLYNNRSLRIMISCLTIFAGFNTLRFATWVYKNLREKYLRLKKSLAASQPL